MSEHEPRPWDVLQRRVQGAWVDHMTLRDSDEIRKALLRVQAYPSARRILAAEVAPEPAERRYRVRGFTHPTFSGTEHFAGAASNVRVDEIGGVVRVLFGAGAVRVMIEGEAGWTEAELDAAREDAR